MPAHPNARTTLVLGGTGKTGRRLVDRLGARGLPVRVGSRGADPAFDWEDRGTWAPALDGVGAVYIAYQPDIAVPGARDTVAALIDAALAAGARRLVLLSGRGEEEAERAEQALIASGADWTVLRASWFAQNFSEGFFRDAMLSGELALPAGDIPEPFVDADDIADIAFAALTDDAAHVGRLYELTGPRALTFAEATAELARASGRAIAFHRVPADDFTAALAAEGVPADLVWLTNYLFATVLDGRNARPQPGVQQALGRPPRDFAAYVRQAAAAGAWS
jgi:uncharacterized protein YbjT (DUF2867 family)